MTSENQLSQYKTIKHKGMHRRPSSVNFLSPYYPTRRSKTSNDSRPIDFIRLGFPRAIVFGIAASALGGVYGLVLIISYKKI